ncbi:helix-turn-helix transcriptional regulator [Afipia clevelandensis]|uniref:Helix-turn-helix domain-containing protein n=1 Tax=Afipia clevelandensis ATCC 49720 TaxID=883079 RepID=K8PAL4_9BRAD|nr:hypothetical protein [Afipia clevelandensis]EKS35388.1 hypothetical protein HMPREF9696_02660 [Afipia clevelandensis ATCC 49720]
MRSNNDVEYLTAAQVRARFGGTSRMWLHRRIAKDDFPAPVTFGGRYRHFKLSEIEAWEANMIKRGIKAASIIASKK